MKRATLVGVGVALTLALLCPGAWAAGAVKARISLDQSRGLAGGAVTGHGEGFDYWGVEAAPDHVNAPPGVWTNAGSVEIHWNSLTGAVVAKVHPGLDGHIDFTFRVPRDAEPGRYTVVATQTGYDGELSGGTPARAQFRVVPPAGDRGTPVPTGKRPAPRWPGHDAANAPASERDERASGSPVFDSVTRVEAAEPTSVGRSGRDGPSADLRSTRPGGEAGTARHESAGRESSIAAVDSSEAVPWHLIALAALALGLAGGAGGAYVLVRRRRPLPSIEPDAVEAELQEMLAEEHARLREHVTLR